VANGRQGGLHGPLSNGELNNEEGEADGVVVVVDFFWHPDQAVAETAGRPGPASADQAGRFGRLARISRP
jgi:hypothetical protein